MPLSITTVATLGFFPTHITADAWYMHQQLILRGGIAMAKNQHGHPESRRDTDGVPFCATERRMHPTSQFSHTNGDRSQPFRCPFLFPEKTGLSCEHDHGATGKGCITDLDGELGGQMRVTLDRAGPLSKAISRQRTSTERGTSHARALGRVRLRVHHLDTLTLLMIHAHALQ